MSSNSKMVQYSAIMQWQTDMGVAYKNLENDPL